MLKTILFTSLLFASNATTGGFGSNLQANPGIRDCPNVLISCPDNVFEENSDLKFYTNVHGSPDNKVKYHWSVGWVRGFRKGRIKSGQGTPSLVISASGPARRGLTVTVTVTGLPKGCGNEASCTTMVAQLR